MTDQVTSIEQSKRLIELGVPADKASMVWEWGWVCGTVDEENYELKIWQECKPIKNFPNLLSPPLLSPTCWRCCRKSWRMMRGFRSTLTSNTTAKNIQRSNIRAYMASYGVASGRRS